MNLEDVIRKEMERKKSDLILFDTLTREYKEFKPIDPPKCRNVLLRAYSLLVSTHR